MTLRTFRGGVHPSGSKDISKDKPVVRVVPKGELVYPLSQHLGAPAVPVVKKGDSVLAGQKIAEAGGFISAPVHASVSGTVKGIEPRLTVTGNKVDSIIVQNDKKYESIEYKPKKPLEDLTKEEIVEIVKEAGIVGMGGAGFPTYVKLSPKEPDKIDYMIVNCVECEPYLTSDYRLMMEEPQAIIEGLKVILRLFDNAKGIIAIEDNKPDCIRLLTEMTKDEERIEVRGLKTKYPQGAERQLIYVTTGRAIHSGMLPNDAGCIVNNLDTVASVYRAVVLGQPLIHRILTITGDAIRDARNFSVLIGTDYLELIEAAGGFRQRVEKIISGGPMMGACLFDLHVPTTKTSSALICLTKDEVAKNDHSPCIKCGRCVTNCPGRVIPSQLADLAQRGDESGFLKYEGMECCECGCCSYICPAKRRLTQAIKSMRRSILANRKR